MNQHNHLYTSVVSTLVLSVDYVMLRSWNSKPKWQVEIQICEINHIELYQNQKFSYVVPINNLCYLLFSAFDLITYDEM